MKISKMSLEDLESIKDFLITDFDDFWNYNILLDELNQENSYFIVAKNDNSEIIGFACLKKILDEGHIMNIVVRESYRGNGFGSNMLEHLIDYAKNQNLKIVLLEVNEHNLSAIRLYNKFEFDHLGIRKQYYPDGSDAIIMSKKI